MLRAELNRSPSGQWWSPLLRLKKESAMNEMLMIQDDAGVGRGFTRLLGAYHFKAPDWIGGVSSKDLIGGTLQAVDVRRQPVQIHLKRYALAFVDGRIIGVADGWELVPILKQAGIV